METAFSEQKDAKINRLLGNVSDIPPLPSVTTRILDVAENPLSSAHDLTEIISHDPALTAQILKAANSAFYGFPNKIGTVYLAIVILGFNMVRTIALSVGVLKLFRTRGGQASLLNPPEFWAHSLKCGVASKLLATNYKYYVAGEAFTAGILHDIGRIVLAHYSTSEYNEVLKFHAENKGSLLEAEEKIFGFSHAEVGGYLLKKWSLPVSIVDAVSFHHAPELSQNAPDLASITHLADYLSHLHSHRHEEESDAPLLKSNHWGVLPKPHDENATIEQLLEELSLELRKAASFLTILQTESAAHDELRASP
jgi:HD-like signal output (HDOD) protein